MVLKRSYACRDVVLALFKVLGMDTASPSKDTQRGAKLDVEESDCLAARYKALAVRTLSQSVTIDFVSEASWTGAKLARHNDLSTRKTT